jgi:hypothetical protein
MLLRNFLVDLHGSMQRPGERRILDHGYVVRFGDLADFPGDQVDAFGDADRRVHAALVAERDGKVGRVGDDDGGFRHRRHDALSHPGVAQLPKLAFDHRVAFGLAELLLDLLQRHFLPLVPLPILEQVVGGGDDGENRHHGAQHLHRQRAGEGQDHRRIAGDEIAEVMALRPQQRRHDGADDAELHQALGEIGQRLPREKSREARAG